MKDRSQAWAEVVTVPVQVWWQWDGNDLVLQLPAWQLSGLTLTGNGRESLLRELDKRLREQWGVGP